MEETDAGVGMGVREDLQSSLRHREPTDTSNELAMRE